VIGQVLFFLCGFVLAHAKANQDADECFLPASHPLGKKASCATDLSFFIKFFKHLKLKFRESHSSDKLLYDFKLQGLIFSFPSLLTFS